MGIRIGDKAFHRRVEKGLQDSFMRGAVTGAQDRLRTGRLNAAKELGIGKNGVPWGKRSVNIRWRTSIFTCSN